LTELSWPKRYPLVQFPNAPLILAFLAGQAAGVLHGAPHSYASAASYLAMIVWAYELFHGDNLFRHLLVLVTRSRRSCISAWRCTDSAATATVTAT
jgi:hypothetical protein